MYGSIAGGGFGPSAGAAAGGAALAYTGFGLAGLLFLFVFFLLAGLLLLRSVALRGKPLKSARHRRSTSWAIFSGHAELNRGKRVYG